MSQVERFYDEHAERYESKFQIPLFRYMKQVEEEEVLNFLFEHLGPPSKGKKLLELGCGTGLFTLPMLKEGFKVTAVDISEGMLSELRKKLDREMLTGTTVVKADVEGFQGTGELFDGVYGIGLLEYLKSPVDAICRAVKLLRPGGIAVFTAPTVSVYGVCYLLTSFFRKRMRMKIFTQRSFERTFVDCGMELIETRSIGFHLPCMRTLTRIVAARL